MMSANWKSGAPVFGDLSLSNISCTADLPCPVFGLSKNLSTPYVINWNANVQQAMWKSAALTIAYVGNKVPGSITFAISTRTFSPTTRQETSNPADCLSDNSPL